MNFSFFIFHSSLPCGAQRPILGRGAVALRSGFSLVEISMVLLLFASAVGGLLSFFPVGLRLENNAISDSAQTMFALNILGQAEANAAKITSWSDWNDTANFIKTVFDDVEIDGKSLNPKFTRYTSRGDGSSYDRGKQTAEEKNIYRTNQEGTLVEKYLTSRGAVRYVLQVSPVEAPIYFGDTVANQRDALGYRMRRIVLWVTDRRDGDPLLNTPFTLDLVFQPDYSKIVWEKNASGKEEGEI